MCVSAECGNAVAREELVNIFGSYEMFYIDGGGSIASIEVLGATAALIAEALVEADSGGVFYVDVKPNRYSAFGVG